MNFDRKAELRERFLCSRLVALIARVRSWLVPAGAGWAKFDGKKKLDQKERQNGGSNR